MPRYPGCALAAVIFAIACDAPPTHELLEVALVDPTPIELDVVCPVGACGIDTVQFEVTFQAHTLVADTAEVELVQYRVDYTLPSVDGQVPYFAEYTPDTFVPFGQTITVPVQLVGDAQRAWLRPRVAGGTIDGTAKVLLAGYDHRNAQVAVEVQDIAIRIGDFDQGSR